MLLGGQKQNETDLMTPKGILLHLELHDVCMEKDTVICAVRKDAGDDPDTTNGILVYARVEKCPKSSEITVDGGKGVGRVTRPGLSQKVGEAAINPVPKAMILKASEDAADRYHYEGGLKVTISVPEGEKIAKKTFNPRLGIQGGISILGTSGIVETMSEKALIQSIQVEMKQHFSQGEQYLIETPEIMGQITFGSIWIFLLKKNIKCSNYVGETIDMAVNMGVKGILFYFAYWQICQSCCRNHEYTFTTAQTDVWRFCVRQQYAPEQIWNVPERFWHATRRMRPCMCLIVIIFYRKRWRM